MSEMNPPLSRGPVDEIPQPQPFAPLAGNHSDDDGQALDDLFEGGPWAPVESEGLAIAEQKTPAMGRLMGGVVLLYCPGLNRNNDSTEHAVQVLPADPNRKHLIFTGAATDGTWVTLLVSDSAFSLDGSSVNNWGSYTGMSSTNNSAGRAPFMMGNGMVVTLDDYTGPVWVAIDSTTPDVAFALHYASVTS